MKRILSLILAFMIIASAIPVAFAAIWTGCQNCENPLTLCPDCNLDTYCPDCDICESCGYETPDNNTNDHTAGTLVVFEATNNESYTITVPAKLNPGQSGIVTLAGRWPSNKTISVTAEPTVTLTNSILASDQKVLDITFIGISKAGNDTTAQTFTESVSVEGIENALFGTWNGKFNYNVSVSGEAQIETPLKFGQKYICTQVYSGYEGIAASLPVEIVAYSDGSGMVTLTTGESATLPASSFIIEGNKISISESTDDTEYFLVSDDGLSITFYNIGQTVAQWTLESANNSFLPLYWTKSSVAENTKISTSDPDERCALVTPKVVPQETFVNTTLTLMDNDTTRICVFEKIEAFEFGYTVVYFYNGQSVGLIHVFEEPGIHNGIVADVPGCYFTWVEVGGDFGCVVR